MNAPFAAPELERLFSTLRPNLHRYCARMTGSSIDGEDVVQSALVKAIEALPRTGPIAQPEAWLFRCARRGSGLFGTAQNASGAFLRSRARRDAVFSDGDSEAVGDPADPIADR